MSIFVRAIFELLLFDLQARRGFSVLATTIRTTPVAKRTPEADIVDRVVNGVYAACAFYYKSPQCLQRSAAVTRLLRRRGIAANVVIGCQIPPFRSHAWVEVSGRVVSDNQTGLEHYRVLDRW